MIRLATVEETQRLAKAVREGLRLRGIGQFLMVARASNWCPGTVARPGKKGETFQDLQAWIWIAEQLESGHPVELIELRNPLGALGWVMKVNVKEAKIIYVKLQLSDDNFVIGRSFHYSTTATTGDKEGE